MLDTIVTNVCYINRKYKVVECIQYYEPSIDKLMKYYTYYRFIRFFI